MPGLMARLAERGLVLQPTTAPMGNYLPAVVEGNLIFCAGATCMRNNQPMFRGKLGRELTVEQGVTAARVAVLNALQKMVDAVGDPDRIGGIVKLVTHVNCTESFVDHALISNAASDLLVELFGEDGRHARLSLGVNSLPANLPLELEITARLAA
jgi:enamine deaminase RidA (YjgF/YER057c/UK114 family)